MMHRRSRRRLHTTIAAVLLVISVLPASAGPVLGLQACPSNGDYYSETTWMSYGVTQCRLRDRDNNTTFALLQIVDFAAGADVRVVSQVGYGQTPGTSDTLFIKRSVPGWFDWTEDNVFLYPDRQLFSTTNASFFITTSGSSTALSLPEAAFNGVRSMGYAMKHTTDLAWNKTPKKKLGLGFGSSQAHSGIGAFPTHWNETNVYDSFANWYDGVVGYDPLLSSGETYSNRTMVGRSSTRLYILSAIGTSLSYAKGILTYVGSVNEIQLDGGHSMETYSYLGASLDSGALTRDVPDVLAVYLAD